jgi:hypothetical protein
MTKYREILRLHSQGVSNRLITVSLECSRNTIRSALSRAEELDIHRPLADTMTDRLLEQTLFGKRLVSRKCTMPDFSYIHQELAKSGVTLSLLWNEYCENCRMEGNRPLMYTQFCYHYQRFAAKNKATLHLVSRHGCSCGIISL